MTYPVDTPAQAKAVLRALRRLRGLSQAQLGERMGLSQKRIARIEAAPSRVSFDQITKLFSILGYRTAIEEIDPKKHTKKASKPDTDTW